MTTKIVAGDSKIKHPYTIAFDTKNTHTIIIIIIILYNVL